MTTLPQTTPMRMPRSNGQGALMVPPPQTVGIPAAQGGAISGANPLTPSDIWRVVRTNAWLIGGMVVIALVLGFFVNWYLLTYHSAYTATGYIRVQTAGELVGAADSAPQSVELEQRTQAQQLTHETLWFKVLRTDDKIRQTVWFQQFKNAEEAKADLEEHFDVQPIPNSRLIRVAMQFRVPADSKTIVEEVAWQHIRDQRSVAVQNFIDRKAPLQQTIDNYDADLRGLIQKIREKSKSAGSDGTTVQQIEIQQMLSQKVLLDGKKSDAINELQALDVAIRNGEDPPGMYSALSSNLAYVDAQRAKSSYEAAYRSAADKYGPDHPNARSFKRQLDTYQGQLDDMREEVKAGVIANLKNEYLTTVSSATKSIEAIEARRETLDADMQKITSMRAEIATLEAEQRLKQEAVEKARAELSNLSSQVLVGKQANVEWATLPETPDRPSFPKLWLSLLLAGVSGLVLSLAIAFTRELTDTSVRSPRDIARVGQINLLGMITHQDDDAQSVGARLPLVIFDAPQSVIAEQLRQVRTRLQHAASLDTTRSMLITGASAGDGKTTIACNLAAGLALNGRKILLVDANFRRPELARVFEMDNETGFSDVLGSLDRFDQCVRETHVPNLAVLTSGRRPTNPTELLESQLLIDFIERALEEYDHVIFDSGPLPLVSETAALAPRVDGVVTVVRAQANSRGLVQRVRDQLRQVKAEHLGMVLNAVRAQVGGYYGRNILDYYKYQNHE